MIGGAGNSDDSSSAVIDEQALRDTRQALQQNEELFREISERLAEVFYVIENDGRVSYVSPAYETIWGRPVAELTAQPMVWLQAVYPEDREQVDEALINARRGDPFDIEYRIRRPDGAIRWVHDRFFPVEDPTGVVLRSIGAAQDVTNEKLLEHELQQAVKLEAIGTLASGIAHDFNNVLQGIAGLASMAGAASASPEQTRLALQHIKDLALRSGGLARQLMAFSRHQAETSSWINVDTAIHEAAPLIERLLGRDIGVELQLAAPHANVHTDPVRLDEILMNLASNARDAMPNGGVLTLRTAQASIDDARARERRLSHAGAYMQLEVQDSGSGMDDTTRRRIFEPFFSTKGLGRGMGLGLTMVARAVGQLGGHIDVHSAVGRGTTFVLVLPCSLQTEMSRQSASLDVEHLHSTALIVEDDSIVRLTLRGALEDMGLEVFDAAGAALAQSFCELHTAPIDILIADVILPLMTGPQMATQLRQHHPELQVLYVSGQAKEELVERGILTSDAAFVQKPFARSQMAAAVTSVLKCPHSAPPSAEA